MATALDLVTSSFRLIGVAGEGQSLSAEDSTNGLEALNSLLEQWSIDRLAVYQDLIETFTWPAGTQTRTIGPTGDFVSTRPTKILSAFIRDSAGYDRPLELIGTAQYQDVYSKAVQATYPASLYYSPAMSNGTLYLWPVPQVQITLGIATMRQLTSLALSDTLTLPPGYAKALRFNLAMDLAAEYGAPVSNEVARGASESKAAIERINLPEYRMQNDLCGIVPDGSTWDIISGSYR